MADEYSVARLDAATDVIFDNLVGEGMSGCLTPKQREYWRDVLTKARIFESKSEPLADSELRDRFVSILGEDVTEFMHPNEFGGYDIDYVRLAEIAHEFYAAALKKAYLDGHDAGFAAANVDDPWAEKPVPARELARAVGPHIPEWERPGVLRCAEDHSYWPCSVVSPRKPATADSELLEAMRTRAVLAEGERDKANRDNESLARRLHLRFQSEEKLRAELDRAKAEVGFHGRRWLAVEKVLDEAIGTEPENGAGEGLASDVALLAAQRDEARAELADHRARLLRALEIDDSGEDDPYEFVHSLVIEHDKDSVRLKSLHAELDAIRGHMDDLVFELPDDAPVSAMVGEFRDGYDAMNQANSEYVGAVQTATNELALHRFKLNDALGIVGAEEDTDPYEAVRSLHAEIDRLRAELAAGVAEQQWCVWYGGPDPNDAAGVERYDDESDAREALQWYRSDLGSGIAVRDLKILPWRPVTEATTEQTEPSSDVVVLPDNWEDIVETHSTYVNGRCGCGALCPDRDALARHRGAVFAPARPTEPADATPLLDLTRDDEGLATGGGS